MRDIKDIPREKFRSLDQERERKLEKKITTKAENQLEQKHMVTARDEDTDFGLMMMSGKKTHYHLTK